MASNYKNYAEALYLLAEEEGRLDSIYEEITEIDKILAENKDYFKIFSSPAVTVNEKLELIDAAFSDACPTVIKFMKLLASKGALCVFGECAKDFTEIYLNKKGIVPAEVRSCVPLSEEELKAIEEKILKKTGKQARLSNVVDPALLGGAVLSYDGKELDGSLKTKLESFKKSLY